jgi:hypothetical protein
VEKGAVKDPRYMQNKKGPRIYLVLGLFNGMYFNQI